MRLGMVTTFYPPYSFGGDATYVRNLSRGLAARGHEVEVIHCQDAYDLLGGQAPDAPVVDPGVRVHRLHSRGGPLSPLITQQTGRPGLKAAALKRLLGGGRFDVVNFHNISLVGGPGVLAYSRAPITLYTLHEHWLVCPTHIFWKERNRACDGPTCLTCCIKSGVPPQLWRYGPLIRKALDHVDQLIAPSAFTAEKHAALERAIEVLPLFAACPPPAEVAPVSPSTFVVVGRVTASKGVEPLLRVFARLPHLQLLVMGDGDQRPALEQAYAASPNIRFLGALPQAELAKHYAAAVALILPSIAPETFGLGVVEAAACGTPALVTAGAGGAVEIIQQTGGGLIYRNEGELAAALRDLSTQPDLRQRLGAAARAGYAAHHTLDRHLDRYEALIARVLEQKRADGGPRP
jgi:glycosyltransferase involved in cell wall biosynthesis